MKNFAFFIILGIVLALAAWFAWLRPAAEEPEAAAPATEVPVHVARVVRTTLHSYVTAYGTVEPEPAGERPAASARVAPAVPGVIVKVNCSEGQHVAQGEVLFELDSRTADVAVEYAGKTLERQKQLLQVEGTSQQALQEAEQQFAAARVQQALLHVQAPLAGTVTRVNVRSGEAVDLATILADIIDLDRLVVNANVPDTELETLATGQTVSISTEALPDRITGQLVYLGAEVNTGTGTVPVRISLPPGSGLRPGQFVHVQISNKQHENSLAVPEDSVVQNEDGATVIAVVRDGVARQTVVTTGLRENGMVEVTADGLQPDMVVVTEGAYALPGETRVRVLDN